MTKLEQALESLVNDIASGAEYPDAEWRAARKFGVKAEQLRAAYDGLDDSEDQRELSCEHYAGF